MPSITDVRKSVEPAPPKTSEPAESSHAFEISWRAPEYVYYHKTPDWFWAVGIIGVILVAIAYFTDNLLFGFLIIVGAAAFGLYGARKPNVIRAAISNEGLHIGNRLFPYETLQSFWIFYRPGGIKELSIASQKLFMTYIKVPLGDQDPNEVREFLLQFLQEKPQKESLVDTIARLIRY